LTLDSIRDVIRLVNCKKTVWI